jgi:hypothetical protein
MGGQLNLPRVYRADLAFPPWEGRLPWALPQGMARAAREWKRR